MSQAQKPLPKTLFQMAGAELTPHRIGDAALVIIDAQREYVDGLLPLPGIDRALDEEARILAAARAAKRPVIHVRHKGRGGGAFDPDGPGYQIDQRVAPEGDEAVIDKALPNAFAGTDLEERLRALDAKNLIVVGFMTHMCVSSTVRAALDRGLMCTVVADACATRDLPDGRGGIVAAADLHRAELAALSDRFAVIAETADAVLD
jgi:nicotinamidase-related amidase